MASLTWNHASAVGIEAIDDQHGVLLDALNELRTALLKGCESRAVRGMLRRLKELMQMHVVSEDRLLARTGFPELAAHRAEHQRLLGRLAQFDARYEQRQTAAVYELVEYLRKWFTTHTGVCGQRYGAWLKQHGVR